MAEKLKVCSDIDFVYITKALLSNNLENLSPFANFL